MAPIMADDESKYSDYFEKLAFVQAEGVVPVTKYRSKRTGLTVFVADIKGPVVHGYCYLATEAHDDDGLPHTLEHLIFLGSESYPYKGVLDLAANRSLASGTNAWTSVDHTCYTYTTAGSEGFLQLLPIYLDHILFPVLTDAGFITEVHHVNGDGEDAGVVYCEMQSRENVDEIVAHVAAWRAMYPHPSGYRSVTGGIMKNLRESTTNEKVREYHAANYRSENIGLIVAGQVPVNDLLGTLLKFEEKILNKPPKPEFTRPWQSPVPPLKESINQTVLFPCDEETNGLVIAAWRGPMCIEIETYLATMTLLEYLSDTAIAPLHKEFVEQKEPYCSQVNFGGLINSESCFYFSFEDVPVSKLPLVKDRLINILTQIADGVYPFDMKRMQSILHRKTLEILNYIEAEPQTLLTNQLIADFLYGVNEETVEQNLNSVKMIRNFMGQPVEFWLNLLKKFFVDKFSVVIVAKPSREHMEKQALEEKERILKQQKKLGEEGLKQRAEELRKATDKNEIPPPEGMVTSIPVPDITKIQFLSINQSSNHPNKKNNNISKFQLDNMPVCFLLDDVSSNFVRLSALLNTAALTPEQRLYLPLFCEVIFQSPILRGKALIDHETIIAEMLDNVVKYHATVGLDTCTRSSVAINGKYSQIVHVDLTLETARYSRGVEWLRELLFATQFTSERLKVVTNKLLNNISRMKRLGDLIVYVVLRDLYYKQDSNSFACNLMRQHTFLSMLLIKLESNPDQVIRELNEVRNIITNPASLTVYMAADVTNLAKTTHLEEPWMNFLPTGNKPAPNHKHCFVDTKSAYELILPIEKCNIRQTVIGIGAVESSFLVQCVPCVNSYNHPDLPAILVLLQYLTQLEGPMWRQIRGLGLAYGYNMIVKPEEGLLYLALHECSHVVGAYREAKTILENHLNGKETWQSSLLVSARSSLAYEIIEREKNIPNLCHQSLLSYFRKVDYNFNRQFLEKVWKVDVSDLNRVGPLYVEKLLSSKESRISVCCHPSKVDEIVTGFKNLNQELNIIPNLEEGFLCSLTKE